MIGIVIGLYRLMVGLLPADFREVYGEAIIEEARLGLNEAASEGLFALLRAVAALSIDFVFTWLREWGAHKSAWHTANQPGLIMDARFALRSFRRAPAFTATILLTLGLGIGANTAIFSVVDSVLLRPLPYDAPDRLVAVWSGKLFSRSLMADARAQLTTLEDVGGYSGTVFTLTEGGDPTEVYGLEVTPNHFRLLGASAARGRTFLAEDGLPGAEPVAVLSHKLWLERFAGDLDVLGRTLELQSEGVARRTIVGIMPPGYRPLRTGLEAWVPVVTDAAAQGFNSNSFMEAFGRLRPNVDRRAAEAEVVAFAKGMHEEQPGMISERDAAMATAIPLAHDLAGSFRLQLMALFACVGLVLLIACTNVANLLLARTTSRARELSVRRALGADWRRLLSLLLTEGVLLGLAGGACGVVVAYLTRDALLALLPGAISSGVAVLDGRVLAFSFAVAGVAGLLFGAIPALNASRPFANGAATNAASGTRGGSVDRRSHRIQHALMAGEISLALVAVFAAGLLSQSVRELADVDPGFQSAGALTLRLTAPASLYPTDADVLRYFEQVRDRVAAVPGVEHVGVVSRLPLGGGRSEITIVPEGFVPGPNGEVPDATHRLVSPGYAEAMGFRLREGRLLTATDVTQDGPKFGYVNATLAERFWPSGALGKSFIGPESEVWLTVIGVVDDVREDRLNGAVGPALYIPHNDWAWRTMHMVIRTGLVPSSLAQPVKEAIWTIAPSIPVTRVRPMTDIVEGSISSTRVTSVLFAVFGALSLLLGCIGVYGVVAHALGQRRREFGVRIALGASSASVARGALRGAGITVALGLLAGVTATPLVGSILAASVQGVRSQAPGVLLAASVVLASVALAAAWLPARRAAAVDPVESLRAD